MKHITTEKNIFFIKMNAEDMIKPRFTPGGSVAVFESANNSMTPIMLLP